MGWFQECLIPYKLQYFLNFGGLGAASPFLHVFGRQLGLGQVAIGWVFALAPFLDMLCKPAICSWADRHHLARTTFLAVLSVTTVSLTSVVFIPPVPTGAPPGGNVTNISGVLRSEPELEDAGDVRSLAAHLRHYQFWLYAVLVLLAWIGVSTNQTMADGMTAKVVERLAADFGRQRLWGTVGLSVLSTLSGYLIEASSSGDTIDYSVGFYLCGALMSLDVILCIFCFKVPSVPSKRISWGEIGEALRSWRVLCFSVCCASVGVCTGLLWSFQFWYLDDLARLAGYSASKVQLLEGLTLLVKGLGCQIPLMFMSGAVLRRIGHQAAVTLSICALGVHFIVYSQLTDPWYCLLVEPLAGAAFGLLYPAIASYACRIAPEGTAVTTQAVMAASFDGLGVGVGTLLSAYVFSRYGGSMTFLLFGSSALIVALFYSLAALIIERHLSAERAAVVTFEPEECEEDAMVAEVPSQAQLVPPDEQQKEDRAAAT